MLFSGRLHEGDQILEVNGQSLEQVTNGEWVFEIIFIAKFLSQFPLPEYSHHVVLEGDLNYWGCKT